MRIDKKDLLSFINREIIFHENLDYGDDSRYKKGFIDGLNHCKNITSVIYNKKCGICFYKTLEEDKEPCTSCGVKLINFKE